MAAIDWVVSGFEVIHRAVVELRVSARCAFAKTATAASTGWWQLWSGAHGTALLCWKGAFIAGAALPGIVQQWMSASVAGYCSPPHQGRGSAID